jgi:penicillin-binding protein 1B
MGLLFGFVLPYTLILNKRVQDRFNDLVFAVPTRVYARRCTGGGYADDAGALEVELTFSGYSARRPWRSAGSWVKQGSTTYTISSRGYAGPDGGELPKRIRVTLGNGVVQR